MVQAGDRIVIESERASQSGRGGVIEAVLMNIRLGIACAGTTGGSAC